MISCWASRDFFFLFVSDVSVQVFDELRNLAFFIEFSHCLKFQFFETVNIRVELEHSMKQLSHLLSFHVINLFCCCNSRQKFSCSFLPIYCNGGTGVKHSSLFIVEDDEHSKGWCNASCYPKPCSMLGLGKRRWLLAVAYSFCGIFDPASLPCGSVLLLR